MRTQIRDAVFETNSSSSHSVTVAEEEIRDFNLDKETIRSGVIRAQVFPDGYGWQWLRFYKPENILAYLLYQAMPGDLRSNDPALGVDLAGEIKASDQARHIIETVEKATGLRVEFVFPDEPDAHFYVDHDSYGNGLEFAQKGKEEELLRLIFGRNSYIELGNDNDKPGEYMQSDIGEILTCAEKMVDEPVDAEAQFVAEFSLGYGETASMLIDADGDEHRGVLSFGWMHSILGELRGATLTEVKVSIVPETYNRFDRASGSASEQAREAFFQWLNTANAKGRWIEPGDDEGTDIRLLRGFLFEYEKLASQPGHRRSWDDRGTIRIKGVASRDQVDTMAASFDDLLARSEEMCARREAERNAPT